jgi:CspA family cold shock protein
MTGLVKNRVPGKDSAAFLGNVFEIRPDRLCPSDWIDFGRRFSLQKSTIDDGSASRGRVPMLASKRRIMTTGTVKWYNSQKGFGFIQPDDGGKDAFVHVTAIERAGMSDLREGQKISFELVTDARSGKISAERLQAV